MKIMEERAKQGSLRQIMNDSEKWEKAVTMKAKNPARSQGLYEPFQTALYAKLSRLGFNEF